MDRRNDAFTIVEIMTVVTIIAILVGILLPAIAKVKTMVKETEQQVQINTLGLAINAFKNDYGDYPPSDWYELGEQEYTGGQMLTEALIGWDGMGFHPDSDWKEDGRTEDNKDLYKLIDQGTEEEQQQHLKERVGPYLEQGSYEAFLVADIFDNPTGLGNNLGDEGNYMLCDVFHDSQAIPTSWGERVKPGAPILYYRANTSSRKLDTSQWNESIYNFWDNIALVRAKRRDWMPDKLAGITVDEEFPIENDEDFFYKDYIRDPKIQDRLWPYRPDSYLLISAGADGEYGTPDDITNFKK